jgi:hypothetical protein
LKDEARATHPGHAHNQPTGTQDVSTDNDAAEQQTLFLERYSPVEVGLMVHLPEGNARSFMIASALGRILAKDGTFAPLAGRENGGGSVVGPTQRKRVLAVLNIKPRRWRDLVADWETRYVAHKCGASTVCLFTRWLPTACPACKAEVLVTESPPRPDARRRKSGSTSATKTAVVVPLSGTNSAAGVAPTVPPSGTKVDHPKSGFLTGKYLGHRECVRCSRYGTGHVGEHLASWPTRSDRGIS